VKVGDLVRDNGDNDLGLVVSEVRSYDLDGEEGAEYVWVQWSEYENPQDTGGITMSESWIEVISESR
jgi:hypothetical protein